MPSVKVTVNDKVIKSLIRSLSPGSNLQKLIDMETARLSDPFAPSDTASLRKSVFTKSSFGSGRIVYEIYGRPDGRNTWNDDTSRFQGRPVRGPRWAARAMNAGGREKLQLEANNFIKQRGR